jgi:erythrocyte band 7 integral membrane protein
LKIIFLFIFNIDTLETGSLDLCSFLLVAISYFLIFITLPFSIWVSIKIVKEYERAVIFRLGRNLSGGAKGPGLFFILPCVDNIQTIDLRTITFDVPPQEILTKDSVTVSVDAVVYYRIFDPVMSVNQVANVQKSTRLLAATTLRNILGTKTLQEILIDKESIAHHMQGKF